ncbi:Ssl1-domain-containing protein [Linderina pennispora]|uniref:General transcription and DNA repair factor IIH n=1 Tax=Linderina pennispora TaxID=61395 RepID=A0A1Y1VZC9_9FUNG|nr:Ssl1-domain-containing protein [Linderina pennispora]ORX66613.1 Ssl1-domain-containing protein [Linderina pennispora]
MAKEVEDEDYIDIDDTGPEGLKGADGGYAWEEEYKRSWDVIQEDESGSLQSAVQGIQEQLKRKRRLRDTTAIQRGIIRHVILVIDGSENMGTRDMRPTRIAATLQILESFVNEYFDQNPISQLAIISTKDGLAEKLTDLSGNPLDHVNALRDKSNKDLAGEPSLQNALELAMHTLRRAPTHGSREIVCIFGSLTTCDPGDIKQTQAALKHAEVRVSMVQLAAEVQVFKRICQETNGLFAVADDEIHLKDMLFECIPPPPVVSAKATSDMIQMGFPIRASNAQVPTPCVCHHELSFSGYICPRCRSKVCSLPTDCDVCGLPLVSAPHLARSYHHLFPEENYREIDVEVHSGAEHSGAGLVCFGCEGEVKGAAARYQCPRCRKEFCLECDVFIHETLHNCPGCV